MTSKCSEIMDLVSEEWALEFCSQEVQCHIDAKIVDSAYQVLGYMYSYLAGQTQLKAMKQLV